MYSIALIENVVLLFAALYAYKERGFITYLIFIGVMVSYITFDVIMLSMFNINDHNYDNSMYFLAMSGFFFFAFTVYITIVTKLMITFACCALAQAFTCLIIGMNGFQLNGIVIPNYDIIYNIQTVVNSVVLMIEIFALLDIKIYTARSATTAS